MEILERDAEVAALRDAAARAATREGAVVLLEAPAGLGKTALLRAARTAAQDEGLLVLSAIGAHLDRAFPFGLVHQLLGPVVAASDDERRERLLSGSAARAARVLDPGSEVAAGEPDYAVLHALYWLVANLADEQPVALLVDDLHWADRPSLRLLEYVGRRIDGVGVLLVGATRPDEPGADTELLGALAGGPAATVLTPRPLSEAAAGTLLATTLASDPEPAFTEACTKATGGSPLLLQALGRRAAEHGLHGLAGEAGRAAELGAVGIAGVVDRRLRSLGRESEALARAAAVLGERRGLDDLAAVAELEPPAALAAADRLAAARLLEAGTWAFVHPLMRDAVLAGTPHVLRTQLHARAAARLRLRGARPDEVAIHLLATEPSGDPEVVAGLVAASQVAASEGAPDVAVRHLQRALEEPPGRDERPQVLLRLGELMLREGDAGGLEHLAAALALGLSGDDRARALAARGAHRLMRVEEGAVEDLEAAQEAAEDPALALRVEALALETIVFPEAMADRRRELLTRGRAAPEPSAVMLANLAHDASYSGAPVDVTLDYARRALDGGLMAAAGVGTNTFNLFTHALRYAEQAELMRSLLVEGESHLRRAGEQFQGYFLEHSWAYWHHFFGSCATGLSHALAGLEATRSAGLKISMAAFAAVAAELLLEQDRLDAASQIFTLLDIDALAPTISGPFALSARGLIRLEQGDRDGAETDLRRAHLGLQRRGWSAPMVARTGVRLARLLGPGEESTALLDRAEEVARAAGTRGALGVVLRHRGLLTGGDEGVAILRQGVAELEQSPLGVDLGWALHDLGALLRRLGRRGEAREPLRAALDLAGRREALLLARMTTEELAAAGARPRRTALKGPESLTPSERRVAELAASGLTNREIAESLWVTRKTVELHLGNAYGKLGIRTRTQLASALGTGEGDAAAAPAGAAA